MPIHSITGTIAAQDTFSAAIQVTDGKFDLSLSGAMVGTVTLQRRRTNATTWLDVETYTADAEKTGEASGVWEYRVGVKTGEYTSGTLTYDLSV